MSVIERRRKRTGAVTLAILMLASIVPALAQQLDENCIATLANHSVQVSPDGTYAVGNIPWDIALYRARVICKLPDGTTGGWPIQARCWLEWGHRIRNYLGMGTDTALPAPRSAIQIVSPTGSTPVGVSSPSLITVTLALSPFTVRAEILPLPGAPR